MLQDKAKLFKATDDECGDFLEYAAKENERMGNLVGSGRYMHWAGVLGGRAGLLCTSPKFYQG